jgi:hypothetical protein
VLYGLQSRRLGRSRICQAGNESTLAYCAAAANYKNGITLAFVLNSQFEWGILLIDPSWNLTYNASYPIDDGRRYARIGSRNRHCNRHRGGL